jgi:hypothetical protein
VADPTSSTVPDAGAAPLAIVGGVGLGDQYDVVAQACAMAVSDATAYLRNTELIATAVIGVAMERLVAGVDTSAAMQAIEAAQTTVLAAARTLAQVAQTAAEALANFTPDVSPEQAAPGAEA